MSVVAALPRASRRRRVAGWTGLAAAIAVVGLVGAFLSEAGQWAQRDALDPDSAGPNGARAIARVLDAQGVPVRIVRDRAAASDALRDADATLVLPDTPGLSDETLSALAAEASTVVLLAPRSRTLDLLLNGSSPAGAAAGALTADCDLAPARRAAEIEAGDLFAPGAGVTACYGSADGAALLSYERSGHEVVAVDGRALLSNESVTRADNAALALALLGTRDTVVWYMPALDAADATGAPSLGDLTPPWVTPAIVLLLAAAAAGLWRGRRFGPLVAESLPVTVRAAETTEGRARLYARSRDAAHALAQLRAASRQRLARLLGLGRPRDAGEVADAVAQRLGEDRAAVRGLLVDAVPDGDRDLVRLSDALHDLEARVRAAVRPEGDTP